MLSVEEMVGKGVDRKVAEEVFQSHKDSINGEYIPKSKFDSEREKLKILREESKEMNAKIEALGKSEGTVEELNAKIKQLQEDSENLKNSSEEKLKELQTKADRALKIADLKIKLANDFYDTDDVITHLDLDAVTIEDGKITGLDDQIKRIKETKPHWVRAEEDFKPKGIKITGKEPPEGKSEETEDSNTDKSVSFAKTLLTERGDSSFVEAAKKKFNI